MKFFNNIKLIRIIIFNLIILLILYNISETAIFIISLYKASKFDYKNNQSFMLFCKNNYKYILHLKKVTFETKYKQDTEYRPILKPKFSSPGSILIFGCSFAYGAELLEEQTISYKLSKLTNRKVINRASPGWGPQNMLYQVKREDFYEDVMTEQPEYVIYIFMEGHYFRTLRELFLYDCQTFYKWNISPKIKKLTLSFFQSGNFLYGYTARQIRYFLSENYAKSQNSKIFFMQHFIQSKIEMENHWKKFNNNYKTKYIIFVYSYTDYEKEYLKEIETITNNGIKVIFMEDITSENMYQEKYQLSKDDNHPNDLAWNHIAPRLAKKIGLIN